MEVGTPPTVSIASPVDQMLFLANDTIALQGSGLDGTGEALADSALRWLIEFRHDDHLHPYASIQGGTG